MKPIPEFPEFRTLELKHRDYIKARLNALPPETSTGSFANLFLWRAYYRTVWTTLADLVLVLYRPPGADVFALPPMGPGPRVAAALMLLEWLDDAGCADPRIERADAGLVEELGGRAFEARENSEIRVDPPGPLGMARHGLTISPIRDHFDYLYVRADLVTLSGRQLHAARNHVNRINREYSVAYEPLSLDWTEACLELADRWCKKQGCEEDVRLAGDRIAVEDALQNQRSLGLSGGVVLLDGSLAAFALGERLTDTTVLVHSEKTDTSVSGLSAVLLQKCCENAWAEFACVNRGPDAGDAGLRQAKLAFRPCRLVPKYRIRLGDH